CRDVFLSPIDRLWRIAQTRVGRVFRPGEPVHSFAIRICACRGIRVGGNSGCFMKTVRKLLGSEQRRRSNPLGCWSAFSLGARVVTEKSDLTMSRPTPET